MKVNNEAVIPKNRTNLIILVEMTWKRIIHSTLYFPPELRQCFVLFRERLQKDSNDETVSNNLISASIFLRFLCPAILSPSLFNITQEMADDKSTRILTLVAKTLQTLANFTKFQGKEEYMEFMNEFIEKEQNSMKHFLRTISSRSDADQKLLEYSGEIDLGVQLSILHTLLSECVDNLKPSTQNEHYYKNTLKKLIDDLEYAKSHPNNDLVQSLSSSTSTASASSTMIDHQRLDEQRQRLQPISQNAFQFNDPTAAYNNYSDNSLQRNNQSNAHSNYLDGSGLVNQQIQQQHHANDYENNYSNHPQAMPHQNNNPSSTPSSDQLSTPRSSTLPRSNYLVGSGRKPAMDLHTADDYVHLSALGGGQINAPVPIGHSFSQSHIPSDSSSNRHNVSGSSTPVYGQQRDNQNHHQHFHNHARYNTTNTGATAAVAAASQYQMSPQHQYPRHIQNPANNNNNNNNNNNGGVGGGGGHRRMDDSLNSTQEYGQSSNHDYDQNSSGDADTNMKGSQTSISQLSNIGSSGYQSFAYSQSSSPVDSVITHNDVTNNNSNGANHKNALSSSHNNNSNNNNTTTVTSGNSSNNINNNMLGDHISIAQLPQITQVLQPPPQMAALAFNNPMYHLNAATSVPNNNNNSPGFLEGNNRVHPSQVLPHHLLINTNATSSSTQPIGGRPYPLSHSRSSHAASYSSSSASNNSGHYQQQRTHHNQQHQQQQSASNNIYVNNCNSSLSSAQSVEDLVCARVTLSGSDDSASLISTTSTPPHSGSVDLPSSSSSRHSNIGYANHINNSNNVIGLSAHFPQHHQHTNNSFKSGAPRTNPRYQPPPFWSQQTTTNTTNLHSSITNIPSSINNSNNVSGNKTPLDHHRSTSDLLSSPSYQSNNIINNITTSSSNNNNNSRRGSNSKSSRRQSAEFAPSRQRMMLMQPTNYDSTSDDTSSDERPSIHHPNMRPRHHNSQQQQQQQHQNNRVSVNRASDSRSLEEVSGTAKKKSVFYRVENSMKSVFYRVENSMFYRTVVGMHITYDTYLEFFAAYHVTEICFQNCYLIGDDKIYTMLRKFCTLGPCLQSRFFYKLTF